MRFLLRAIRKISRIFSHFLSQVAHQFARVEHKATRILLGVDYSVKIVNETTIEEKLYGAMPWITPINPSLPAVQRPPKVTLLIPSLVSRGFYGGAATALIFAARFALYKKLPLRIVQTNEPGDNSGLKEFFQTNDIGIDLQSVEIIDVSARRFNVYGYLDLHPKDIFIATAWWDARLIEQLPLLQKFIYLIQDYEPIFYPNGDYSVLAENTYHSQKFIPVCNTELMYEFMSEMGYSYIQEHGLWFEPAVSRVHSGLTQQNTGKQKIFLYGRPNVERNLFHLSLAALNQVFADGGLNPNEWEIFMAGQDNIPDLRLSSGIIIQNLGKMSMEKYLTFSKTIDLAISPMMAPHPNYPTLEFASIGASVVTTKYKTKQSLTRYSPNIFMSDLSLDSLVSTIISASKPTYLERMAGMKKNAIPDSWESQLTPLYKKISLNLPKSS